MGAVIRVAFRMLYESGFESIPGYSKIVLAETASVGTRNFPAGLIVS